MNNSNTIISATTHPAHLLHNEKMNSFFAAQAKIIPIIEETESVLKVATPRSAYREIEVGSPYQMIVIDRVRMSMIDTIEPCVMTVLIHLPTIHEYVAVRGHYVARQYLTEHFDVNRTLGDHFKYLLAPGEKQDINRSDHIKRWTGLARRFGQELPENTFETAEVHVRAWHCRRRWLLAVLERLHIPGAESNENLLMTCTLSRTIMTHFHRHQVLALACETLNLPDAPVQLLTAK